MTFLPMAHAYNAPAEGARRCATCGLRKRSGVHVHNVPESPAAGIHARRTARYRTSGVPYLAESSIWRLASTRGVR